MTKTDVIVFSCTVGIGSLCLFVVAPVETLVVLVTVGIFGGGVYAFLRWFGVLAPLYVQATVAASPQAPQRLLLTDSRHRFAEMTKRDIQALPMAATDKQTLYRFTMQADCTLSSLMKSEKVPVNLSGVRFGALTVTFRLRLREFSRQNLDKLMKLDALIAQALSVESVRLIQGAGHIDCEVSSPVRAVVDVRALQSATQQTTVAIGLDTMLRPAQIDVSQHGLIAAIAPSRRGKTQAIRTMLYLLKRANPSLNLVIVAFKSQDWQAFNHCAALILDSQELKHFQSWLLQTMYDKAKQPDRERWVIVFDDLVNLLSMNPELVDTVKQCASLGAGVGVTTIVSTQFTGKDSGGVAMTANATARLMFKPSSNLQGARDGGMAGLGLDQLSTAKGDALLVVDGESVRIATAMTADNLITQLHGDAPNRDWLQHAPQTAQGRTAALPTAFAVNPMETLIEQLNGFILDSYDFDEGKFANRSEALRRLGWSNNGRNVQKLGELEQYIFEQAERYG